MSSPASGALLRSSAGRNFRLIQDDSDYRQSGGEAFQRHLADHRHPGESLTPSTTTTLCFSMYQPANQAVSQSVID